MSKLILPTLFAFVFSGETLPKTDYIVDSTYTISIQSEFALETTKLSSERDGVPVEASFANEGATTQIRKIVLNDRIAAVAGGQPTRLQREFATLKSHTTRTVAGSREERDLLCPLKGLVLGLEQDGEQVRVDVHVGSPPSDDRVLQGHRLPLPLDALYPKPTAEAGASWPIEGASLIRALGFDHDQALFPQPTRREVGEPAAEDAGPARYFQAGAWLITGTLEASTEEWNGVECRVVVIQGECSGDMPDTDPASRERQEDGGTAALSDTVLSTFALDIQGKLYVSLEGRHPLHFELEGNLTTKSSRAVKRGDTLTVVHRERLGKLHHAAEVKRSLSADEQ